MGNKEQGKARTGGDVEEERVGGRGYVLPEEGEPQNHIQAWTAQDRACLTYWWCGNSSSGGRRVCHHPAQTGRLLGPHEEVEGEEDNGTK